MPDAPHPPPQLHRVVKGQTGVTAGKIWVQLDHPSEQFLSAQDVVSTWRIHGPARFQKNIVRIDARRILLIQPLVLVGSPYAAFQHVVDPITSACRITANLRVEGSIGTGQPLVGDYEFLYIRPGKSNRSPAAGIW